MSNYAAPLRAIFAILPRRLRRNSMRPFANEKFAVELNVSSPPGVAERGRCCRLEDARLKNRSENVSADEFLVQLLWSQLQRKQRHQLQPPNLSRRQCLQPGSVSIVVQPRLFARDYFWSQFKPDAAPSVIFAERVAPIDGTAIPLKFFDLEGDDIAASYLLLMARLKIARSRVRWSIWSLVRIAQRCFWRSGGSAPISFPLFQGIRPGAGSKKLGLSYGRTPLVAEEDDLALRAGRL